MIEQPYSPGASAELDPADLAVRVDELSATPAGDTLPSDADHVVFKVLEVLESGEVRAAQKDEDGTWRAVPWARA